MAKGREAVDFQQFDCKKPRGQSPKGCLSPKYLHGNTFFTKATNSRREFGLDMNGNPIYGWEAIDSFSLKI